MTTVKNADVPAAQKCKHSNAPHHSRGKCKPCYRAFRKTAVAAQDEAQPQLGQEPVSTSKSLTCRHVFLPVDCSQRLVP